MIRLWHKTPLFHVNWWVLTPQKILAKFRKFLHYYRKKFPIERHRYAGTHAIFMTDRDREPEQNWIQKERNERETAKGVLAMQAKRTRTQSCRMHIGHLTAGNPQYHPEDATVTWCCLHRSSSFQVNLCRSYKNKDSFKNCGKILPESSVFTIV